jgi:hypothetical protein
MALNKHRLYTGKKNIKTPGSWCFQNFKALAAPDIAGIPKWVDKFEPSNIPPIAGIMHVPG